MAKQKVKIQTAEYQTANDLIFWTLLDLDNESEQTYCWPRADYLAGVVGLSEKAQSLVTPELLHEHCKQMLGKEIFFEVRGNADYRPKVDKDAEAKIAEDIEKTKQEVSSHYEMLMKSADAMLDRRKPKGDDNGVQ